MKSKRTVISSIFIVCLLLLGLVQPIFADGGANSYPYGDPTIEADDIELYDMIGNDAMSYTANVELKTEVPATVDIQVIGRGSVRHGDRAYHGSAHLQTTYMKFQIVPDDGHVLEKVMWNGYDITRSINRGMLQFHDLEDGVLVAIFKEKKIKELPCPMADDCCCCKKSKKCCDDRVRCCREPEKCCREERKCAEMRRRGAPCGAPCGKGPCKGECCKGPCADECYKGPKVQTADKRDELVLCSVIVLMSCAGIFTLTYIKKTKKHLLRTVLAKK